jgi:hypothetical protein
MKKYKVLKPYPGSENLGEKIEEWTIPYNIRYDPLFSQYYEEVIEKDYEILSFKDLIGNLITKKGGRFLTSFHETEYKEKELIKSCNIHSIKRLLDGELFTVDDLVSDGSQEGKILRIRLANDGKYQFSCALHNGWTYFTSYKKTIKPLFTTEDGVDIFRGSSYYNVNSLFNIKKCKIIKDLTSFEKKVFYNLNNNNCFSTRTAAEEYVLMNKPCLSINNIMSVTYNPTESKISTTYKLIKLVQKSMENDKN